MEKKKSSVSSNIKENFEIEKSYLDLSNYSVEQFGKQQSIHNTNEICNFFTNITNNQKDLTKKYDKLFSLIKNYGKEIKYLLEKCEEYHRTLNSKEEYIKKVNQQVSMSPLSLFEEADLYKEKNNLELLLRLSFILLHGLESCHTSIEKCNEQIEDVKKNLQNKNGFSDLERKLTYRSEEIRKQLTNNMMSLKEQQEMSMRGREDQSGYRKEMELMYSQFLKTVLKLVLYNKKYIIQRYYFMFWLDTVRKKKKAIEKIITYLIQKEEGLLIHCMKRLKNNCYETAFTERILVFLNHGNSNLSSAGQQRSGSRAEKKESVVSVYPSIEQALKMGSKINYSHLESMTRNSKKSSVFANLNTYSTRLRSKERSIVEEKEKNALSGICDSMIMEESTMDFNLLNAKNEEGNETRKSYLEEERSSPDHMKKMLSTCLNQLNAKADKKNLDVLYQSIKKLNYKVNEIKNSLQLQKKINDELLKNNNNYSNTLPEKYSLKQKDSNSVCNESSEKGYKSTTDVSDSIMNLTDQTLQEYNIYKVPSHNTSKRKSTHLKNLLKQQIVETEGRGSKYSVNKKFTVDDLQHPTHKKGGYDDLEKLKSDLEEPKLKTVHSTCSTIPHSEQRKSKHANYGYLSSQENKKKGENKYNFEYVNTRDIDNNIVCMNNDHTEDLSSQNINVVLRTGGGFRKLSEHDKNNYLQKVNYLNENNLLGYETNLNIKIKGPALIHNHQHTNQNTFKKEKRHRSLSKFYNL